MEQGRALCLTLAVLRVTSAGKICFHPDQLISKAQKLFYYEITQ